MLSRSRTAVRSLAAATVVSVPLIALAMAGPASADVPVGWEDDPHLSGLHVLLVFAGIPLAIAIVLAVFGYVLSRRTRPSYLDYVAAPTTDPALEAPSDKAEISSH